MRKKKLTEARRIQRIIAKDEPALQILVDLDKMELCHLLNWYNQNRERDDSHDYLEQYCLEKNIPATREQIEKQVATLGFVARLLTRDAKLDDRSTEWFNKRIQEMLQLKMSPVVKVAPTEPAPKKDPKAVANSLSKQEYGKCFSDLEAAVDIHIESGFKDTPNVAGVVAMYTLQPTHRNELTEYYQHQKNELHTALDAIINKKESEAAEAYQGYTIVQLRKFEVFVDQILAALQKESVAALSTRKPRKKKVKTPEMQVKRLKYLAEEKSLGIKSIDPTKVIGASTLWVYHVPSRMLTQYIADRDGGFEVKGCAILNYAKDKSQTKKLRKPETVIPQVLNGGKVALRHILDELTTKNAKVTGRVNSQTVILRALI